MKAAAAMVVTLLVAGCLVTKGDGGVKKVVEGVSLLPNERAYVGSVTLAPAVAWRSTHGDRSVKETSDAVTIPPAPVTIEARIAWSEEGGGPWTAYWRDDVLTQGWTIAGTCSVDGVDRKLVFNLPDIGLADVTVDSPADGFAGCLFSVEGVGQGVDVLPEDRTNGTLGGSSRPPDPVFADAVYLNDLRPRFVRSGIRWDGRRSRLSAVDTRCRVMVAGLAGDDIEPPAANALKFSEDLSVPPWFTSGITVQANVAMAPDGTQTADRLMPGSVPIPLILQHASGLTGERFSASVFLKSEGIDRLLVQITTRVPYYPSMVVHLAGATFEKPDSSSDSRDMRCVAVGDGWVRASFSVAAGVGGGSPGLAILLADGTTPADAGSLLVWGAQLTASEHPVPYLPTVEIARMGAAETLTVGSEVLAGSEGTILAVGFPVDRAERVGPGRPLAVGAVTFDLSGGFLGLGGGLAVGSRPELQGRHRIWTIAWDAGGQTIYENGIPIATGAGGAAAASLTIGALSGNPYSGGVAVIGWPRRLTDGEVFQASTALGLAGSLATATWGDSLVQGATGAASWPDLLQAEFDVDRPIHDLSHGGNNSNGTRAIFEANPDDHRRITLICTGRNNMTDPDTVMADIQAMVDAIPAPAHYLIMSTFNGLTERSGTGAYAYATGLNQRLSDTYGPYYLDIRSALVAAYDPMDPDDVFDHDGDVPPRSLLIDGLHPNTAGNRIIAALISTRLAELGW